MNGHSDPTSMTPSTWSSNTISTTITLTGRDSPIAEAILTYPAGTSSRMIGLRVLAT